MKERLSELIDGEVSAEDIGEQLRRLKSDGQLRGCWDIYHLIGDALRGHVCPEIAPRVVARLREEPTVLAPTRQAGSRPPLARYAISAAAGIAAVALVVWTAAPLWRVDQRIAAAPTETVSPSASVAADATQPAVPVTSAEVENYLLAHQPYSHTSAMQGIAPYVRTVGDERRISEK